MSCNIFSGLQRLECYRPWQYEWNINHEKIAGCVLLNPMDVIRIGNTWFVYQTGRLWVGKPRYEMQKRGVLEENCGERNQSSEVENQNLEERYRNPEVQNHNLGEAVATRKYNFKISRGTGMNMEMMKI